MMSKLVVELALTPLKPAGKQSLGHQEMQNKSTSAWTYHTLEKIPEESQGIMMEDKDIKYEEKVQADEDSNMAINKGWKEKALKRVKGDFRRKSSFNANTSLDFKNEFESKVEIYTSERKFQCMEMMRKSEELVELAGIPEPPAGKRLLENREEHNGESAPDWTYPTLETIIEESNSIVEDEDEDEKHERVQVNSSMTINKRWKEKVPNGVKRDFRRKSSFNTKNYLDFNNEVESNVEIYTPERKLQKNDFKNEQMQPVDREGIDGRAVEGKSKEVEQDDHSLIDDTQSVDKTYSSAERGLSLFCLSPLANASFDRSKTPGIKWKRQKCKTRQRTKQKHWIDDEKEWTTRACTLIEEAEDYELQIE
uniref:uncharacterized protein n=1 Tax=Myxine glutinosa TaxID=7769 RepID=UPI00358FEC3A